MSTTQLTDTIQTQTLELITQGQQATVKAVEAWTRLVTRALPSNTRYTAFLDRLPDPAQATDRVFDYTEALLASQRSFVTALVSAVAPVAEATQQGVQNVAKVGAKRSKKA